MGDMKVYSFEEMLDEDLGKIGTPEREAFEAEVQADIRAYYIGEAIRQARKGKHLTQEQLGELMGVQRAQVSKIESGKNLNFATIARAFKAMGIPADLSFSGVSLALW
ncbi:MAG: helix-turn-helix domain-containing protein [Muribaculaceae bacterium]|nr:helix-turn-helix domain-containing protein [Muribaculaceae bacterium]